MHEVRSTIVPRQHNVKGSICTSCNAYCARLLSDVHVANEIQLCLLIFTFKHEDGRLIHPCTPPLATRLIMRKQRSGATRWILGTRACLCGTWAAGLGWCACQLRLVRRCRRLLSRIGLLVCRCECDYVRPTRTCLQTQCACVCLSV